MNKILILVSGLLMNVVSLAENHTTYQYRFEAQAGEPLVYTVQTKPQPKANWKFSGAAKGNVSTADVAFSFVMPAGQSRNGMQSEVMVHDSKSSPVCSFFLTMETELSKEFSVEIVPQGKKPGYSCSFQRTSKRNIGTITLMIVK